LEAYAKRVAQSQPDVTKALGAAKLSAMRAELAAAAAKLGADLKASVDQIPWDTKWTNRSDGVHHALFEFMYGARVDALTRVLKASGFKFDSGHGILPQDLYDQNSFGHMVEVNVKLGAAVARTARARAANERSDIDSLWDESGA
jgi:hypothetical protein